MPWSLAVILSVMLIGPLGGGARSAEAELSPAVLRQLERQATRWLLDLEQRQQPLARPLSAAEKVALAGHFTARLLDRARLREVAAIDNPEFYTTFFAERGSPLPIDFRRASGMALIDTVLIVSRRVPPGSDGWLPLLFHELVHLAQVEVQGPEGHVAAYVRGWAVNGFEYRAIPQEAQAFELAARFRAAPSRPFSVAAEVAGRFGVATGGAADETPSGRQP